MKTLKKTELKRRTPLRAVPRQREPGEVEWKKARRGCCEACGMPGWVVRHHVVLEQHVRVAGGDPWDMRNSMDVGVRCDCHELHHSHGVNDHRISLSKVPHDAIDFAFALYGQGALFYLRRHYKGKDERVELIYAEMEPSVY